MSALKRAMAAMLGLLVFVLLSAPIWAQDVSSTAVLQDKRVYLPVASTGGIQATTDFESLLSTTGKNLLHELNISTADPQTFYESGRFMNMPKANRQSIARVLLHSLYTTRDARNVLPSPGGHLFYESINKITLDYNESATDVSVAFFQSGKPGNPLDYIVTIPAITSVEKLQESVVRGLWYVLFDTNTIKSQHDAVMWPLAVTAFYYSFADSLLELAATGDSLTAYPVPSDYLKKREQEARYQWGIKFQPTKASIAMVAAILTNVLQPKDEQGNTSEDLKRVYAEIVASKFIQLQQAFLWDQPETDWKTRTGRLMKYMENPADGGSVQIKKAIDRLQTDNEMPTTNSISAIPNGQGMFLGYVDSKKGNNYSWETSATHLAEGLNFIVVGAGKESNAKFVPIVSFLPETLDFNLLNPDGTQIHPGSLKNPAHSEYYDWEIDNREAESTSGTLLTLDWDAGSVANPEPHHLEATFLQ